MKTRLFTLTALLLATAACTKDELADGDRLPEGQYPVEIARITLGVEGGEAQPWGAPQTRVGEAGDGTGSVFSAGDRFAVQINGEEGIYIVQDNIPSPPGTPQRVAPSTSATRVKVLPTCCTAQAAATTRLRSR